MSFCIISVHVLLLGTLPVYKNKISCYVTVLMLSKTFSLSCFQLPKNNQIAVLHFTDILFSGPEHHAPHFERGVHVSFFTFFEISLT